VLVVRNIDSGIQSNTILAAQQVVQRTLPTLERRIDDVIAAKPPFVDIDVSHVQIIDSIGLNWLLSLQSRLETLGSKLRLLDPSPIMADVLLATRLDSRLTVEITFCKLPAPDSAAEPAPTVGGANGRK
jgi:anti-anti-sigma factor